MNKKRVQRVISFMLALVFVMSGMVVSVFAEDAVLSAGANTVVNSSVTDATIDDVKEILNSMSYAEYFEKNSERVEVVDENGHKIYEREWSVDVAKAEIVIDAITALYKEGTDAEWSVGTFGGVEALYTPADGTVSWKVNIPETARYSVIIEYFPVHTDAEGNVVSKATAIERIFRINSAIPFLEARYLTLAKNYANEYVNAEYKLGASENAADYLSKAKELGLTATSETREDATYIIYAIPEVWTSAAQTYLCEELKVRFFSSDIDRNEIRPATVQSPEWTAYEIHDANGYYAESFEFVFEKSDETVISLTGVNEPMAIKSIRLVPHATNPSYSDVYAAYASAAVGTDRVKIEAEYINGTTSHTIYPIEDTRSSVTSPNTAEYTMLNSIGGVGGDKWQTSGQKLTYKFAVNNSGRYNIVARFSQSTLDGMYTSRTLEIYTNYTKAEYLAKFGNLDGYYNGVPFEEATKLRFDYSSKWQSKILSDGNSDFEFYFRDGVDYTIALSVTLGSMGDLVSQVEEALSSINSDYLSILKLTGAEPDDYRDYGFIRVMPEVIEDLVDCSELLYDIAEQLRNMAGVKGSMVATLEKVAWLLDRMGRDPEAEIAKNLTQLKSYIGSLGTWVSDAKTQPLQLDYLVVQGVGNALPRAEGNFFQNLAHEMSSFFQSFFRNYDRMGALEEYDEDDSAVVEAWLAYGRDQTQVIRNLVNNEFTPQYGHAVNLKLVAGGTLLPSILSKSGPDVYIGLGQGDVINYAIRGALLPIEDCNGFYDLALNPETSEFNEAAMIVLGMEDAAGTMHYYGLPETQSFNMMFIREDILAELGLDIPKTWDDVLAAIPVLQANNMQIGMHTDYKIFLYQMGGELFADGGMRINLDADVALDAFDTMCNMFTMYSFPYTYDFANRFRTGEMPIGFAPYTGTYNQLKVFATEIEGLWGMYPMPGIEDEYGNINNASVSGVSAIVMITGCDNIEGAWDFMRWHSGASCQEQYSNEMVSILGPSAKHPTANLAALESLPWTSEELKEIKLQFNNLASIPNYPGSYIIDRYTKFAFLAAYNNGADPVDELNKYITTINKEITRKREEFDLETLDYPGQTLAVKRATQALTLLSDGAVVIEKGVYVTNKSGEEVIEIQKFTYKISSSVVNANKSAFDTLVLELDKIVNDASIKDDYRREILVNAVETLTAILEKSSLGADDKAGVEKALELLNEAIDALDSYQVKRKVS